MRKVCYSVAMSLDGFIAGPKGEYEWIKTDPDIDFKTFYERFDTMLLGRKTYELTKQYKGGGTGDMKVYVFSKTLRQEAEPGVIVSDDPGKIITELKKRPGKDIWLFGGGSLFRALLDLRLVDSVNVAVIPVLLGGGIPLLPTPARMSKLKLVSHRIYPKTGTVSLEYAVAP